MLGTFFFIMQYVFVITVRFHLEQLIANPRCVEVPVLNQIEFNPYNADYDILDVCKENNILVQAYAPLGSSEKFQKGGKKVLENELLVNMARGSIMPEQIRASRNGSNTYLQ